MGTYLRPLELPQALSALAEGRRTVVAGGTDFYPARVGRPLDEDVLDISALDALRGIAPADGGLRIGALATWSDLLRTPLPPWLDGLKLAAREVGGVQVQNAGTLCGNLCNASPAADGLPNLLALDATVELRSVDGARTLPVAAFVTGNRHTARAPEELVTALRVPAPNAGPEPESGARATFLKLGVRKYLVISIAMVAGVLVPAVDGSVGQVRLAVGACSAVAQRLPALEAELAGQPLDASLAGRVRPEHLAALSPIDDPRASAAYRRDAALTLVRRALARLAQPPEEPPEASR